MATLRRTCPPRTRIASVRQIHRSRVLSAKKGAEDRESVNAEPAEYAKSGSDAQAAHSDTAFDPNETRPEAEEDGGKEQVSFGSCMSNDGADVLALEQREFGYESGKYEGESAAEG